MPYHGMACDDTITCHGIQIKSNGHGIMASHGHGRYSNRMAMAWHPMLAIGFKWPWHGMASHAMAI
jgi:hypothetical protein